MAGNDDAALAVPADRLLRAAISASRPTATRSSGVWVWSTAMTSCSMIGPSSRSGGDVVRGRADELHAALVRLVVGLGALEAGQERVVDVDHPAGQAAAQVVGEHLHVARQHDQLDVVLVDQLEQRRLGRRLGAGVTGRWWNGMPCDSTSAPRSGGWRRRRRSRPAGPRCATGRAGRSGSGRTSRHHDQHPACGRRRVELPGHGERRCDRRRSRRASRRRVTAGRAARSATRMKKLAGLGVAELLAVEDVAAVVGQEAGHGVHDAGRSRGSPG